MKSNLVEEYFKKNNLKFKNTIKHLKTKGFNTEQILRILDTNTFYNKISVKELGLTSSSSHFSIDRDIWLDKVLQLIEKIKV